MVFDIFRASPQNRTNAGSLREQTVKGNSLLSSLLLRAGVFAAVQAAASALAAGSVLYVNHAATGANNGTSWANAYTQLQTALSAATSGQEIWVARGLYKPATGTDRTSTFMIDKNLSLYGGFAGTETIRSQRNWTNNISVLSGDLGNDDITDTNGIVLDWSNVVGVNNCYDVVSEWNVTCVIDGFTITGGMSDKNDGRCLPYSCGAGLMAFGGNTTLCNVTFQGNYGNLQPGGGVYFWEGSGLVTNVSFIGNSGSQGGAAYSRDASMRFTHVLFQNNAARDPNGQSGTAAVSGGGLYVYGANNVLSDLQFINNTAKISGGGMETYSPITVSNTLFRGNSAQYGGGMFDSGGSVLSNVTFVANSAERGGGLSCQAITTQGSYLHLTFQSNSASMGGALYGEGVSPLILNCVFANNTAPEGGALWFYYGYPNLINTVIRNCQGNSGSAICDNFGSFGLTSSTLYGNSGGSLLYAYTGTETMNVRNSILWGNSGSLYDGDVPVSAGYSLIQGGAPGGWACSNILSADPLFVDAANGDLHLATNSPAVDAGDNLVTNVTLPSTDLDGNPRFRNILSMPDTGHGTAPIIDLGAFEAQSGSLAIALDPELPGSGTVTGAGSYHYGDTATICATPASGFRFVDWSENGMRLSSASNYSFAVTSDRTLTAVFDPVATTNRVSTAWYRQYGLGPSIGVAWSTNQWNAFDFVSSSGNGTVNWQAYYADLNPSNPAAHFLITGISNRLARQIYFSPSSTGRVYTLWFKTNLTAGAWTAVPGQVNIPGGTNCLTDTNTASTHFYRMGVWLP